MSMQYKKLKNVGSVKSLQQSTHKSFNHLSFLIYWPLNEFQVIGK